MTLPAGIVTFMFTDIVGSSSRWEQDRDAMQIAVGLHDSIVDEAVVGASGHVIKKMGDGFMAVFADPADGVRAAIDAQRTLGGAAWIESVGVLEVRMGIHTGPGEPDDGDYLGPSVNRASRLEAAGHGGQVLVSAATRELVGARLSGVSFRDLGEHSLRGLARPERVFQVEAEGLEAEHPPLRTESTPSNLPSGTKPVVGRTTELEEVTRLLEESRLLTITGAGGAGKTTLALEAARGVAPRYPAGVWLVELAGLSDGRLIPTEILGAMRQPAPPGRDPGHVLLDALAPETALLVLDNCEHLLDDVAALVPRILANSGGVTVVVTSREPLDIAGERVWRIPTLSLPRQATAAAVLASDCGALFALRASEADRSFAVDEGNSATVAQVCRRLDGLPLAIELAAARLRSMSLDELARRISDRFRVLTTGERDALAHHRTLWDAVAWSYDLLETQEQRLFTRLSVFAGGFDLDAAEAVGRGDDDFEVIDLVDHLVAQSLVTADRSQGAFRYRMLETIRQFGAAVLADAGAADDAARAHLAWLADLARRGAPQLEGRDQQEWMTRFRSEIDNIRAGLGWAKEHDPVAGAAIAASLTRFFFLHATEGESAAMVDSTSFLREGHDWGVALLAAAGDALPEKVRGRLQLGIGGLLCARLGRFEEGVSRLNEAATIFERLGDARNRGWAAVYLGLVAWGLRPVEDTVATLREAVDLHGQAGDPSGFALSSLMYAAALFAAGRVEEADSHFEVFLAAARAVGAPDLVAHADDVRALRNALDGIADDETGAASMAALEAFRRIGNYACTFHALGTASLVLMLRGEWQAAARVLGLAEGIRARLNMVIAPYEDHSSRVMDLIPDGVAADAWDAAMDEGRTMQSDEGIDWAIGRLGS